MKPKRAGNSTGGGTADANTGHGSKDMTGGSSYMTHQQGRERKAPASK